LIEADDGIRLKFFYATILNIQNCCKLLYIQFNFDPKLQTDFIDHSKNMKMVIDFNDYTYSEPLADGLRKSLCKDLS